MIEEQFTAQHNTQLHLCDFDGTLTKGDSFVRFLLFAVPLHRLVWGGFVLIFNLLTLILAGKWSNGAGKAAVLSEFFKEKTVREMEALGANFYQQKMPAMLRTALLESLRQAVQKGETVVIVSASPDVWLRPICIEEGFELVCTELEFKSDRFTGNFATPNCNYDEKARRIRELYKLNTYDKIMAYGNSKGDSAMLALANEVFKF